MKLTSLHTFLLIGCVAFITSACSSGQSVIQATPTPLPEDPGLTELTYTVAQGVIERVIEETAQFVPVQSSTLSFSRDGVVSKIHVAIGDTVTAGQLLAELKQDEVNDDLRKASDDLDTANLAYTTAVKLNKTLIESKRKAVANARDALSLLLPGGDNDVIQAAQKALDEKQRAVRTTTKIQPSLLMTQRMRLPPPPIHSSTHSTTIAKRIGTLIGCIGMAPTPPIHIFL
jgi:multidrug efflux pump subunit AcrA (membrane-fusion protein)